MPLVASVSRNIGSGAPRGPRWDLLLLQSWWSPGDSDATRDHQTCVASIAELARTQKHLSFLSSRSPKKMKANFSSASAVHTTQQKSMCTPTGEFHLRTGQIGFCGEQEAADGAAGWAQHLVCSDFWGEQNGTAFASLLFNMFNVLYQHQPSAASRCDKCVLIVVVFTVFVRSCFSP